MLCADPEGIGSAFHGAEEGAKQKATDPLSQTLPPKAIELEAPKQYVFAYLRSSEAERFSIAVRPAPLIAKPI